MTEGLRPEGSPRSLRVLAWLAAVLAIASFPFAVWWLIGDVATVPVSDDADYMFRPPQVDPAVGRTVGVVAVVVFLVGISVVAFAMIQRSLHRHWSAVIGPLLLAGFVVGAGERVVTAGVIGADIGGGFVLLVGGPIVVATLVWSVAYPVYVRRRRARGPAPARQPAYPPWLTPPT